MRLMLAIMFMHLPRDGNGAQSVSGPAARSKPTSIGWARSTERRRAVIDSLSTRSSGKPSSATSSPRTAWPSRRGSRASGVDRNIRARKLTAWARTDSGHPLDALPPTLPDPYAATVPAAGFARVETASRRNLTRVAPFDLNEHGIERCSQYAQLVRGRYGHAVREAVGGRNSLGHPGHAHRDGGNSGL